MLGRELEILLEEEIEMNGEQWYLGHSKEYIKAVLKKQPQYGINDIVRVTADGFLENHIVTVHISWKSISLQERCCNLAVAQ